VGDIVDLAGLEVGEIVGKSVGCMLGEAESSNRSMGASDGLVEGCQLGGCVVGLEVGGMVGLEQDPTAFQFFPGARP